jgi:hypothetical protein
LRASKAFLVREAKRASVEPLAQHPVLGFQVFNNDELLPADPAASRNKMKATGEGFRFTHKV